MDRLYPRSRLTPRRRVVASSSSARILRARGDDLVDVLVARRLARARRGRPKSSSASSRGIRGGRALESPRRRARGGVGPSLRDDVAVTFIVDRACSTRTTRANARCGRAGTSGFGTLESGDGRASGKVDRDRHACTIRCEREEEIEFKLCAVDDEGGGAMDGWEGEVYAAERCAKCEVRCEWPSDDAGTRVSVAMVTEMRVEDNKIETGGAWLAYGNREEGGRWWMGRRRRRRRVFIFVFVFVFFARER